MLRKFLVLLACSSFPLLASFPNQIVIIGDSLSDNGNSAGIPPFFGVPPFGYRFSPITDGTTWAALLAQRLGAETLKPSTQGGTNYAYVGALTSIPFINPSLTEQVTMIPNNLSRNDPVFVWGGANDIFFPPSALPGDEAALNVSSIVDTLHGKGFDTLIVFNLPNMGDLPSAGSNAANWTFNSELFDVVINAQLAAKNFPVLLVNLFSLFKDVIADPSRYQLTNVVDAPNYVNQNTAGFAFWYDGIHPTEASHLLITDYVFAILHAPVCYAALSEIPFALMDAQNAAIRQQLYPRQMHYEPGKIYPFVSGSYLPSTTPALSDDCTDQCSRGGNLTLGFSAMPCPYLNVGIAGGFIPNSVNCSEENVTCKSDLNAWTLSLFSELDSCLGYVNAIGNVGYIDYYKIHRNFTVGPVEQITSGKTHANQVALSLAGSYWLFGTPHFSTGPYGELDYQSVFLKGYSESGADYGNLVYNNYNNHFLVTGIGWEMQWAGCLTANTIVADLYAAINRQWLSLEKNVLFGELSTPGVIGSWPITTSRSTFVSGGIHLSRGFNQNSVLLSLGYDFRVGTEKLQEHFLTVGLTLPLCFGGYYSR